MLDDLAFIKLLVRNVPREIELEKEPQFYSN